MSATALQLREQEHHPTAATRSCRLCERPLAYDNRAGICSPCAHRLREVDDETLWLYCLSIVLKARAERQETLNLRHELELLGIRSSAPQRKDAMDHVRYRSVSVEVSCTSGRPGHRPEEWRAHEVRIQQGQRFRRVPGQIALDVGGEG